MNKNFKSFVALLLTALMLIPLAMPAFAADAFDTAKSQVPIIYIAGDGESIYDKDGKELSSYTDVFNVLLGKMQDNEGGSQEVMSSVANVLLPFLIEGLGTGNYDKYYEMLNKEVAELFGELLLNKDGEVDNGTGISQERKDKMAYNLTVDYKDWRGYYTADDYHFWYDWRLDPLETADKLDAYIQGVKKITGCSKVSLIGRCLGSTIVTAYLAKYGNDDIHGIGLDIPVANGAEIFSEAISGQFKLDANAINRFMIDSNNYHGANIDSFLIETIDLLEKAGVFDKIVGVTKETIYYVVIKGVTSALALSTLATWPSFWGIVSADDYDTAMNYVFGDENSTKREEYAGLVKKIETYNEVVRKDMHNILKEANEKANLCIVCKYGSQMVPVVESRNAVGDQYGSLAYSSYGATTCDIYSTLSDEYIGARVAEGKGKYIAPDKQVDASTCMFPDQTWFIKGDPHGDHSDVEFDIIYGVLASDRQLTVDEYKYGQFITCDYAEQSFGKMTEENCDTYFWKADQKADQATGNTRIFYFLLSLLNWLVSAIEKLLGR